MFNKKYTKVIAVLGLIFVLAGCIQIFEETKTGTSTTPNAGEPIIIGALLPLSGTGAAYGTHAQRVLDIALQNINDAGGVKGRPIKIEYEDGGCRVEQAKIAAENLILIKKAKIIIGGICSSETLGLAKVAEADKVLVLSPGSSNKTISQAGDFIFRNFPSYETQGSVLAEAAAAKEFKKVGAIVEEQQGSTDITDAFQTTFKAKDGDLVVEKFTSDSSDFSTQITKLQAASVDAYFIDVQTPEKVDLILKQLQDAGVKGPFFMNDVAIGAPKEVMDKYKDYVEGSYGTEPTYDKANPELTKLIETYKSKHGIDLPYVYAMAPTYDALYIIKEALETVGEDSVKIKDYLYTIKGRKGLAGELSFDTNGDSNYRYALRVIKGGIITEQ